MIEKVFCKNIVNVHLQNLRNLVKISYQTITIDVLNFENYQAVTFVVLLTFYRYFCIFFCTCCTFHVCVTTIHLVYTSI